MDDNINDFPIIKPIIANNKCFVYDAYTNQIIQVSKQIFHEVNKLMKVGIDNYIKFSDKSQSYYDVLLLINNGFFKSSFVKKICASETRYIDVVTERCVQYVQLQVTRNCNFKCVYCSYVQSHEFERAHERINMSFSTAQKSIDFLYKHSKDSPQIALSFYGGEPLLNYNLIKRSIEYAAPLFKSKPISYHITTNGSLLNDEMIMFFVKHKVHLLISLDGDGNIQDKHRKYAYNGSGTFNDVVKSIEKIRSFDKRI